jgi:hypothetical protein
MADTSENISRTELAIQQLNMGYNTEQDRLLLKVGLSDQTEIALWLTQRIARTIWQLLSKEAHLPSTNTAQAAKLAPQQAVQTFKQEAQAVETLQKLDFETAYQPRKEVLQPGGILIKEVQLLTPTATGHAQVQLLEMQSVDGVQLHLNLNTETILAICNMLQLSAKEAAWTLSVTAPEPAAMTLLNTESKQVLH